MCVQWVVLIRNQPPCSSFVTCKLFARLISFDMRYTNVTQYSGYVARQMLHHHWSNQLISQLRHSTQTTHVTSFSSRGCHYVWWECAKCKAQAQLLNILQTWKVLSLHLKSLLSHGHGRDQPSHVRQIYKINLPLNLLVCDLLSPVQTNVINQNI